MFSRLFRGIYFHTDILMEPFAKWLLSKAFVYRYNHLHSYISLYPGLQISDNSSWPSAAARLIRIEYEHIQSRVYGPGIFVKISRLIWITANVAENGNSIASF